MRVSISRVTSFGARAPGISTAPITTSAANTSSSSASMRREAGVDAAAEDVVEFAKAGQRAVEDRDVGAEAGRHPCGMQADDAAADDRDPAGQHARHAAEQHAAAAVGLLQRGARRLDREATGDLGHRRQERQAAARRSRFHRRSR